MCYKKFHWNTNMTDQAFEIFFRHNDLKQMLDSNKDSLKLEAMKRIIGVHDFHFNLKTFLKHSFSYFQHHNFHSKIVAKGKNASDLFPAVVKNVVSKNIEVCI